MSVSSQSNIKIGKGLGDVAEETLRFFRQIGVEEVGIPTRFVTKAGAAPTTRPLVPPTQTGPLGGIQQQPWDEEEVRAIYQRVIDFDLAPTMANLPLSGNIVMGRAERDSDLEIVKANIALAGKIGLRVLTYNFTALRASEGYSAQYGAGRGASARL